MTVPVAARKAGPYAGNGVQVTYAFAFKIFATTDLVVTKTALASAGSGESTLVLTSDYTVSMNADQDNNPGGNVTLLVAPAGDGTSANSELITITSSVPESQGTSLPTGGSYSAKVVEKALDKATVLIGQLSEKLSRVLKYPVSDTTTAKDLPTAAQRALQTLAFDANGDPIAAQPASANVSAAMAPVVASADTGIALTNLGFSAYFKTLIAAATKAALTALFTPLTTKGDIWTFGAADARQAVGADGWNLHAQSGAANGLQYLPPASGYSLINGYLDWSVAANALTVAIKTWAGTDPSAIDPVYAIVRDATSMTGLPKLIKITAANSVVVSSGSTLGTRNSVPFRLWAVLFDDAGTYRLGVINCVATGAGAGAGSAVTGIYGLSGWGIASSTAEGGVGAADSAQTFYTGAAVASKAYTTLGYATYEAGLAAAGTWSANPSRTQLWGPSVPLPGQRIQMQRTQPGNVGTGNTSIPFDDTIPQNTEGTEIFTQGITPTSSANCLDIQAVIHLSDAAAATITSALFKDTTANALAAMQTYVSTAASEAGPASLRYVMLAEQTTATTLKIRVGDGAGNAIAVNGRGVGRIFGGVMASYLHVEEIMG